MLLSSGEHNPGVLINMENVESINKNNYKSQLGCRFNETVWQIQFNMVSGKIVSWEYPTKEERDLLFDKIGTWA